MTQIPLQARFKQDIVRLRFGTGAYTRGLYVDGAVTATAYKASVQPFKDSGSEALQRLREGDRTKKLIVIYTYPGTLRTMSEKPNNTRADLVYYEGEMYEVQKTNLWKGQILSHDEVWAIEFDAGQLYPGEEPEDTSNVATSGTTINIYGLGNYLVGEITTAFTFYVNGVEIDVTPVGITGSYLDTVRFTADDVIYDGDVVTFDYDGSLTSVLTGETSVLTGEPIDNRSTQSLGYRLDDDGTNATDFSVVLLPTIAPVYNRATYTLTATSQTLIAMPASIIAAPGLATLVEGVPRVCGFIIHSVPSAGDIGNIIFQIYNYGGSGSVLFNAVVTKDTGATTGTIQGQFGTFPPSVASFGTAYTGSLIGAKVAFQLTLSGGSVSAKFFVNGTLLGTSTPISTNGGVFADLYVEDGTGTGVIDISCVPLAAPLAIGYGTFDTGAIDMVDAVI